MDIPNGTSEQADRPQFDSDGWVTVESMKKPNQKISHGNKPKKQERSHMTLNVATTGGGQIKGIGNLKKAKRIVSCLNSAKTRSVHGNRDLKVQQVRFGKE